MKVDRCPNCNAYLEQRSLEQNAGFHSVFHTLAARKDWPTGSGQKITADAWKRLLLAAYERTQGRAAEAYPAVDGHGFDFVHRRSSRLSKREASEFVEYVLSWCADNGIETRLGMAA